MGKVRLAIPVGMNSHDLLIDPDDALDLADELAEHAAIQGAMLGSMGPSDKGGWTVKMQPSPGLTRRMVAFLVEWLGQAENYTETGVQLPFDIAADRVEQRISPRGELHSYVLTVQRAGGRTPHEKRQEAEAEAEQLRGALSELLTFMGARSLYSFEVGEAMESACAVLAGEPRA